MGKKRNNKKQKRDISDAVKQEKLKNIEIEADNEESIKDNIDETAKEAAKEKAQEETKTSLKQKVKKLIGASIHTWIFKCFALALVLEIVLEMLGRRSFLGGLLFVINTPIVYLYNVSIIFFTLLFALFLRKRVFGMILISMVWLICGTVNFIVLGFRVTPFAAIDILMVKDTFSMIDVYYTKFQQILILIAIVAVIIGAIFLFRKTPKFRGERRVKGTMAVCVIAWGIVIGFTRFGVKHNIISDDFANLGSAYKDYGFAYCFTNSIIDNGISKPDDYSENHMLQIKASLDAVEDSKNAKTPNIIVIQLESFFDPNGLEGLKMSKDPIPTFNELKAKYPSGYFTVPAVGAGTANTEFEFLTGLKSSFFGAGEYPYKTTLNSTPVEGMASLLKAQGYNTFAIHNNKASFYDRKNVYDYMGFDKFISLEYMYDVKYTSTGWAKDATLVEDIFKCLDSTEGNDFVFTISVQGHGRYPSVEDTGVDHVQVEYEDKEMEEPFHYYVNQIYEMDLMINYLVKKLDNSGEDYVLILYGDHLPSLNIAEEQLKDSNMFQTEYIIVNNIGLNLEDEDIYSSDISTKLFKALNMPLGYIQKAHTLYEDKVLDDVLVNIAYDMLYEDNLLYNDKVMVSDDTMEMGVDKLIVSEAKNVGDHVVVSGENFNQYSYIYINGDRKETVYVDRETLMIEDISLSDGDEIEVYQVDKSHHELSSSNTFVFNEN